jgi:F-type H+-transporting ATPase subunit delta
MAELATIARPYAEALFQVAGKGDLKQASEQLDAIAAVAANVQMRQYADNPKATVDQVFDVITSVVKSPLSDTTRNLLRAVIENGRLAALPEVAVQFHALVSERSGVSEATVYSAFPIDAAQLPAVVASLEKRFGRKLTASVQLEPELIGGIRVVVGDEVLDTSVKARLDQMKVALTA